MNGITEWEVVGVIVVLMGMAGTVVSWTNGSNKKWNEFNRNLAENTATLKELRDHLNWIEGDINKRLERHEERMDKQDLRLDDHREKIFRLESTMRKKGEAQ